MLDLLCLNSQTGVGISGAFTQGYVKSELLVSPSVVPEVSTKVFKPDTLVSDQKHQSQTKFSHSVDGKV